jgi:hypothetical protein
MKLDKTEVARRQLGTALALFLQDADPVSVHALASPSSEEIQKSCVTRKPIPGRLCCAEVRNSSCRAE